MDTEVEGMQIGSSFDWSVITTGANAFTVTAAASGHTVVGNMVVAAGKAVGTLHGRRHPGNLGRDKTSCSCT
jgi:hypothetical protein